MNATPSRHRHPNPIHIAPLFRWILVLLALAGYGLLFVYVKNQQHQIGEATRVIERRIAEERVVNEVLLARITALSSRAELQRKLQQGAIDLQPIRDNCIARLSVPHTESGGAILRTASNERRVP
jgi:hypothetical protein